MVCVRSEIGRLRRVLVHEPGQEVDRMVPAMMDELLFDDIIYGDRARDEHARFRRVLQLLGAELFEASDLLVESLADAEARRFVLERLDDDTPTAVRKRLDELSPAELATALVSGVREPDAPAGGPAADQLFAVPPLPNWCFQRDPQIVIGDGVVFSSMAAAARHREATLQRAIFRYHPELRQTPVVLDLQERGVEDAPYLGPHHPHLEGGDLLLLSPDVMAIGLSERTNRAGIRCLAHALARREQAPRWLLVVELPQRRAYMHLDTLITQIDHDACLVYSPVILPGGPEEARVYEIDLHAERIAFGPAPDLMQALSRRGVSLEPIPCGGTDAVAQQREQWTDGANALALAPGVITLFDRNTATAEQLSGRGFQIVDAEDLLLGREEFDVDSGDRVCVLIRSHEISRARGGPHCLTHPLVRDPVN